MSVTKDELSGSDSDERSEHDYHHEPSGRDHDELSDHDSDEDSERDYDLRLDNDFDWQSESDSDEMSDDDFDEQSESDSEEESESDFDEISGSDTDEESVRDVNERLDSDFDSGMEMDSDSDSSISDSDLLTLAFPYEESRRHSNIQRRRRNRRRRPYTVDGGEASTSRAAPRDVRKGGQQEISVTTTIVIKKKSELEVEQREEDGEDEEEDDEDEENELDSDPSELSMNRETGEVTMTLPQIALIVQAMVETEMENAVHVNAVALNANNNAAQPYAADQELSPAGSDNEDEAVGLSQEAINGLPVEAYASEGTQIVERCQVCLNDFVNGAELKRLPCNHHFHRECIENWLQRKDNCPLCRMVARLP